MKTFVPMPRTHLPNLDFDSFKLPFATESSFLQTSFEGVNIMDNANNEVTQGDPKSGGSDPKSGALPPMVYPSDFIFSLENFLYLYWRCPLFWALFLLFFLYSSTIISFKVMDEPFIQSVILSFITYKGFLDVGRPPLFKFYE